MFCYDYLQVESLFSYANTKSFCRSLKNSYTNLERKKFIRIKLLVIYIYIYRERNNRHFEDLERSVANLKLFFLKTLLDWVTVFGFCSFSSVHGFMDFCSLCT